MAKVVVGLMGSSVQSGSANLAGSDKIRALLDVVLKHNVFDLDTARVYNGGKSEEDYGAVPSATKAAFKLATKAPGFFEGSLSYDRIHAACDASLAALQQKQIDLYYFHGPDRRTPLEESCRAINDLHQQGKIARFGVSNFNRDEVEEIAEICAKNSWIQPSVYQGGYNPLGRAAEAELFPTLRKWNMAFYGYSPLGGGFFSRPVEELRDPPAGGRYDQMKVFSSLYVSDLTLKLHDSLSAICAKEGLTLKEATLRWLLHHSALGSTDAIILGGSSTEQLDENLQACEKGLLPDNVVNGFEDMWRQFRVTNPAYCV